MVVRLLLLEAVAFVRLGGLLSLLLLLCEEVICGFRSGIGFILRVRLCLDSGGGYVVCGVVAVVAGGSQYFAIYAVVVGCGWRANSQIGEEILVVHSWFRHIGAVVRSVGYVQAGVMREGKVDEGRLVKLMLL